MKKKLIISLLLILFCGVIPIRMFAQQPRKIMLTGGATPSYMFYNQLKKELNVITAGFDKNFDGVLQIDSGDIAPKWFVINETEQASLKFTFNKFFGGFPLRLAVNIKDGILYANLSDEIRVFDINTPTNSDRFSDGKYSALFYSQAESKLFAAKRAADFESSGSVDIFNTITNLLTGNLATGVNPIMITEYTLQGRSNLCIINEGTFGKKNSSFWVYSNGEQSTVDSLGSGANFIGIDSVKWLGYVVLNGGNSVSAISLLKLQMTKEISTQTTGYNGPREVITLPNDEILVSTYSGDIRYIRKDGNMLTYKTGGKAENMLVVGNKLFVGNAFVDNGYDPENSVVVFDMSSIVASVEHYSLNKKTDFLEQNYPNPAINQTTIEFSNTQKKNIKIELFNSKGELVETLINTELEAGSHILKLDLTTLNQGCYFYKMTAGLNEISTKKITVTRGR